MDTTATPVNCYFNNNGVTRGFREMAISAHSSNMVLLLSICAWILLVEIRLGCCGEEFYNARCIVVVCGLITLVCAGS